MPRIFLKNVACRPVGFFKKCEKNAFFQKTKEFYVDFFAQKKTQKFLIQKYFDFRDFRVFSRFCRDFFKKVIFSIFAIFAILAIFEKLQKPQKLTILAISRKWPKMTVFGVFEKPEKPPKNDGFWGFGLTPWPAQIFKIFKNYKNFFFTKNRAALCRDFSKNRLFSHFLQLF